MIEATKDYRTRDEKMHDFCTGVVQTQAELSEAIRQLSLRLTVIERKLEYDRDQRG